VELGSSDVSIDSFQNHKIVNNQNYNSFSVSGRFTELGQTIEVYSDGYLGSALCGVDGWKATY
jgi:hypothetical protein